jgi:hypothetical protein
MTGIPETWQKPKPEFHSFGRSHRKWNSVINSQNYEEGLTITHAKQGLGAFECSLFDCQFPFLSIFGT